LRRGMLGAISKDVRTMSEADESAPGGRLRNGDGRLEVFYVGTNDAIYHNRQIVLGGAWGGETALGGSAKQIVVGQNLDGRLDVFYVGSNDAIYHNWQIAPGGGWSGEGPLQL
jgi:hypothetical protein